MIKFVLASHGELAEGISSSVRLILGEPANLHMVCPYTQSPDDIQKKIKKLFETFEDTDEIIVMTDLLGGSVNSAFAQMLPKRKFWLVTGVSLGLVMELLLIKEGDEIQKKIEEALENARKMMCLCNLLMR